MRKCLIVLLFGMLLTGNIYSQFGKLIPRSMVLPQYRTTLPHIGDTITGNWTYLAPMPHALWGVNSFYIDSAGGQFINKIFICGGGDDNDSSKRYCYLYNIATNQYETADTLPAGRRMGTLVRFGDSLYLVASYGSNFNAPDGALYMYDIPLDYWVLREPMPAPAVTESSVFIWHDRIIVIGGSTSGYGYPSDLIRTYDPYSNTWTAASTSFLRPTTSSAGACNGDTILILGGYNGTIYNDAVEGITDPDSLLIDFTPWGIIDNPYTGPVYRASVNQYWGNMIFGPSLSRNDSMDVILNRLWTISLSDTVWHPFYPNPDTIADIPGIAIRPNADSIYFYFFGGINSQFNSINKVERFAFANINPIGIKKNNNNQPQTFKLYQNYPNPFNPSTQIRFSVPSGKTLKQNVRLVIYDILGREVATLVDENKSPGEYKVRFNGSGLSSGVYIYRLQAGGFTESKKMVLLK
jgi:hypothetical protein